jgi:hypothetical protein
MLVSQRAAGSLQSVILPISLTRPSDDLDWLHPPSARMVTWSRKIALRMSTLSRVLVSPAQSMPISTPTLKTGLVSRTPMSHRKR